jgi:hypothetical protein
MCCCKQVPAGQPKKELLDHLDKVPTYVQALQFTVKEPTVGKSATFVKVDHVIQETKNLMNIISKVVSTCFDCANKVRIFHEILNGINLKLNSVIGKISKHTHTHSHIFPNKNHTPNGHKLLVLSHTP